MAEDGRVRSEPLRYRTTDLGNLAWPRIIIALVAFVLVSMFNPLGIKQNSESATQDFFETVFAAILPLAAITTPEEAYEHIRTFGGADAADQSANAAEAFRKQMGVGTWADEATLRQVAPLQARPWQPIHVLRFDDAVMAKNAAEPRDTAEARKPLRRFARHQLPLDRMTGLFNMLRRLKVSVIFLDVRLLTDTVEDGRFCEDVVQKWRQATRRPGEVDRNGASGPDAEGSPAERDLARELTASAKKAKPLLFVAGLPWRHAARVRAARVHAYERELNNSNADPNLHEALQAMQREYVWLPERLRCLRDIARVIPVHWTGSDYPIGIDPDDSNTSGHPNQISTAFDPKKVQDTPLPTPALEILAAWCNHPRSLIWHFPRCRLARETAAGSAEMRSLTGLGQPILPSQPEYVSVMHTHGLAFGKDNADRQSRLTPRPYARTPAFYQWLVDERGDDIAAMSRIHGCRTERTFLADHRLGSVEDLIDRASYLFGRSFDEIFGNVDGTSNPTERGCLNIATHDGFLTSREWPLANKRERWNHAGAERTYWKEASIRDWSGYLKRSFDGSVVIIAGNFDNARDEVSSTVVGSKIGAFLHAEALQCLLWYGAECPRRPDRLLADFDLMDLLEFATLFLVLLLSRVIVRHTALPGSPDRPVSPDRTILGVRFMRDFALGYRRALYACIPTVIVATVLGMMFLPFPSADLLALILVLGVVFREGVLGWVHMLLWHIARKNSGAEAETGAE